MSAGTDLIYFDNPDDWQLVASQTRTSAIIEENSHQPIPTFDLGVNLTADYIAVVVGTADAKATWFFAGDITQTYAFARGGGNPILSKAKTPKVRLDLNRLQVIRTRSISLEPFRLEYTPPAWFKHCTVRVYRYTGDRENFVEDTLFDIGNAVGVDPNDLESRIDKRIDRLEEQIECLKQMLSGNIDPPEVIEPIEEEEEEEEEIIEEIIESNPANQKIVNAYFQGLL